MLCCSYDEGAEEKCKTSIEKAIEIDKENPDALQMMASFLLIKEKKEVNLVVTQEMIV